MGREEKRKVGAAQLRPPAWQERLSEGPQCITERGWGGRVKKRGGLGPTYPWRSRSPRNLRLVETRET